MASTSTGAGTVLRAERIDRGWTHAEMARQILLHPELGPRFSVSAATIRNAEAERVKRPRVRAAFAMATVLELRVSRLWPA